MHSLFQDQNYPIQHMEAPKYFVNLSVSSIMSDNSVNGINLRDLLSNIIWLDYYSDYLSNRGLDIVTGVQKIYGKLEFLGGISGAVQIQINNRINHKFNVEEFYHFTARTNRYLLTLDGPIHFLGPVYVKSDINYRLLNGIYDLKRDAILLHSDQDFSHLNGSTPGLMGPGAGITQFFDSLVIADRVQFGIMNDFIQTEDIVLRKAIRKAEFQYMIVQKVC